MLGTCLGTPLSWLSLYLRWQMPYSWLMLQLRILHPFMESENKLPGRLPGWMSYCQDSGFTHGFHTSYMRGKPTCTDTLHAAVHTPDLLAQQYPPLWKDGPSLNGKKGPLHPPLHWLSICPEKAALLLAVGFGKGSYIPTQGSKGKTSMSKVDALFLACGFSQGYRLQGGMGLSQWEARASEPVYLDPLLDLLSIPHKKVNEFNCTLTV